MLYVVLSYVWIIVCNNYYTSSIIYAWAIGGVQSTDLDAQYTFTSCLYAFFKTWKYSNFLSFIFFTCIIIRCIYNYIYIIIYINIYIYIYIYRVIIIIFFIICIYIILIFT